MDPATTDESTRQALQGALGASYALERELGRGGMATVWLARDVRHERQVAVKVLDSQLSMALGPERFLKEIALTASLQHPHVLPLFDSGRAADGLLYYVMPYVEGETLRARLAREGPLPVDEAVRIAREVADALAYAHGRGVVHRDVKPENILLQAGPRPHALVADFGIALAVEQAAGRRITQAGISLGTPQYTAPEQAMAERVVDARADVYALGAVTYEMLTGEPPFTGPTAQAVIARVMTEAPRPLAARRPSVPRHVEAAVLRALEKLPADRFADATAFASALGARGPVPEPTAAPRPGSHISRRAAALLAATSLGAGLAAGWGAAEVRERGGPVAPARGPVRFVVQPDSGQLGSGSWWYSAPAISPDGWTIVFAASGPGGARLHAKRASDAVPRAVPGTEDGDWPFFSPDGAWIGFASRGAIRKVRLDGGTPAIVASLPPTEEFFGGTWGTDGAIVFTTFPSGRLRRVAAGGGAPTLLRVADTTLRLIHPAPLPNARALLVTASVDWRVGRVAVFDVASGRVRALVPGTGARYAAGHLVYAGGSGELLRQPFDTGRLAPSGPAEEIASGLDVSFAAYSPFDLSPTGALVYRVGYGGWEVTLTDRTGRPQRALPARFPWAPRFSPDGARLAYGAFAPGQEAGDIWRGDRWRTDVWITELESGATRRLTTDGNDYSEPQWSPDGRSIAYAGELVGRKDVFIQDVDRVRARLAIRRPGNELPSDWAADGRALLFSSPTKPGGDDDLWLQPVDGSAARPLLVRPGGQWGARVSRDGRWVAYSSTESGRAEVYVASYPSLGRATLVSEGGGTDPAWRGDARELYYWNGDRLVAVQLAVDTDGALSVRARTPLFRASRMDAAGYDASPDGSRFVIVTGGPRANRLVVALDAPGR